jgi:4-hydroxy-tetrahydrodipicolinate synthase
MIVTYKSLKAAISGVNFVTPTPFTDDGAEVNYEGVRRNTEAIERHGGQLLIPCGGVSEYYALSDEERVNVVQATAEAADEAYVVGGLSGSTKNVLEMVDRYEQAGVDGIMPIFPHHGGMHERGLREYYDAIASSTDLGVMIYQSDEKLTPAVMSDVLRHNNVVAVKYALSGDIEKFIRNREISDDVVWINGGAELSAPAMALEGAEGFTTGIGNFVPELSLSLMDALREGDWQRAQRTRDLATPLQRLRQETGEDNSIPGANSVGVVKHGMEVAGFAGGAVREPNSELGADDKQRVKQYYEAIQDADL